MLSSSHHLSAAAIAGIVVGVFVGLLVLVSVVLWIVGPCKRRDSAGGTVKYAGEKPPAVGTRPVQLPIPTGPPREEKEPVELSEGEDNIVGPSRLQPEAAVPSQRQREAGNCVFVMPMPGHEPAASRLREPSRSERSLSAPAAHVSYHHRTPPSPPSHHDSDGAHQENVDNLPSQPAFTINVDASDGEAARLDPVAHIYSPEALAHLPRAHSQPVRLAPIAHIYSEEALSHLPRARSPHSPFSLHPLSSASRPRARTPSPAAIRTP